MRLDKIAKIIKKRATIYLANTDDSQWVGDGCAFYSISNLPKMSADEYLAIFGVASDLQEVYNKFDADISRYINGGTGHFNDRVLPDNQLSISWFGNKVTVFLTSQGAMYINSNYLTPFDDIDSDQIMYHRADTYLIVKQGFVPIGVICPLNMPEEYKKALETLYKATNQTKMLEAFVGGNEGYSND